MGMEIELKLRLTRGEAQKISAHPRLQSSVTQKSRLQNTYYDTAHKDLFRQGVALRIRKKGWQNLLTVKSADPSCAGLSVRNEWEFPIIITDIREIDFSPIDNPHIQNLLLRYKLELIPLFSTDFTRTTWTLQQGESSIELALDQGWIKTHDHQERICELELELLSGEIAELFKLTAQLQTTCCLIPDVLSKAERGYALFSEEEAAPAKAPPVLLDKKASALLAFREIAAAGLSHFLRHEAMMAHTHNPEAIHQARVAIRRLRAAIKFFSPLLPAVFLETHQATWKALARRLSPMRDLQVLITETLAPLDTAFPKHPAVFKAQRNAIHALKQTERELRGSLLKQAEAKALTDFLGALYELPELTPPSFQVFIKKPLKKQITKLSALIKNHTPYCLEESHRIRIRFKELRYMLSYVDFSKPRKKSKPVFDLLEDIQYLLGVINDTVVAEQYFTQSTHNNRHELLLGWIHGQRKMAQASLYPLMNRWLIMSPTLLKSLGS